MLARSEQIRQFVQEVLAGRHCYGDLDTYPIEERDTARKKMRDLDGKTAELCQLLRLR